MSVPDPDPEIRGRGGGGRERSSKLQFDLKKRGGGTGPSPGYATESREEYFLFPSIQENRSVTPILQKVTQLHKPKSLTISYCKQFFYLLLPTFGKPRKREIQYVKISTSNVRNNNSHVTSHEMSCWLELLIG